MGRTQGKKSAGPSTTVAVSLRLSPRVHWGLTLLARKRHTTITAVIEWAVNKAISDEVDGLVVKRGKETINVLEQTWDVDPADRFVKLALHHPALLRFEEEQMWKGIIETPQFWVSEGKPNYKAIRERWPAIEAHYLGGKE